MLKKAVVLTLPAPARQDAPFRRQGRSERRGEAYAPHFVWPFARRMGLGERKSPLQYPISGGSPLYVEPLSDTRTPLADFFSILLNIRRPVSFMWAVQSVWL